MSTSRYFDRICIVITVIALIITTLFVFGENLGLNKIVDEDAEGYEAPSGFTTNDMNADWNDTDATVITLLGDSADISGNGAYTYDNKVVISNAGKYVISGDFSGSIIVDAYNSSKVFIKLKGVNVYCEDDAAFIVDQADKVFLTLADKSDNTFESGAEYSEEALSDNTGGAIFSHDDLTINGSGSLAITASYKHGIDCNDKLVITGGNITITAPQDGIHANDGVNIIGATLTVHASDDGISGGDSILIAGGTIAIDECYEGIEAVTVEIRDGDITIECSDDGINANGGSGGFGGMPGGGGMGPGGGGGMNFDGKNSGDDERPEPPVGFDNMERPENFEEMEPPEDFEGMEPPEGFDERPDNRGAENEDRPKDSDSGFANRNTESDSDSDSKEDGDEETWIHISGGNITVLNSSGRDADGLDSNGDIIITGGNIRISLTGSGGNNAIDYGSESGGVCEISGGTVIACASSSMAEEFSSSSTQGVILYMFSDEAESGTTVTLSDEDENTLLSWDVPYSYTAVTISCGDMTVGNDYTITVGDNAETITLDEISTTSGEGSQQGMGSGFGGGHRGGGNFGNGKQ